MRVSRVSQVIIFLLLSNVSWRTDAYVLGRKSAVDGVNADAYKRHEKGLKGRRAVTEEEISYIASTLQPRECLSLLYLLHHGYKRRRRRGLKIERIHKNQARSAQITPCETMLLNYWRDPRSRDQKDFSHVSRTLRQVQRQDLARWLCGRRPSCPAKTMTLNGTNDASSLTAQMQVIPIYSSRTTAHRNSTDSTLDSIIWIYIALAVCATATVLLCINYLFKKFRKSSRYIALADKDIRNMQYACECIDKQLALSCNKMKRYQPPQTGCSCSGN